MLSNGKILIVDPDAQRRAHLCDSLREQHFHITDAASESVALAKMEQEQPDLILLRFGSNFAMNVFRSFADLSNVGGTFIILLLDAALDPQRRAEALALDVAG